MFSRALLRCGILASIAYAIADIGGGLRWAGYSFADYSISELAAVGAPSRPLAAVGILGVVSSFFPIQPRGMPFTRNEIAHMALVLVSVLCIVGAAITGGRAGSPGFLRLSIAMAASTVLFGAMAGTFGSRIATGDATPWLGVIERISVYAYLLWVAAFANMLLDRPWALPPGTADRTGRDTLPS